jgi:hypothetical protein
MGSKSMSASKQVVSAKKAKSKKVPESVVKQPKIIDDNAKLRKKPKYKSLDCIKESSTLDPKLPSWWGITKKAFRLLISANKKNIFKIFFIYGLNVSNIRQRVFFTCKH